MTSQNITQSQASQTILSAYSSGQAAFSGQQQGVQMTSGQWATSQQGAGGQATQVVIGVFNSRQNAEQAVQQLRQQGFTQEEINIVAKKGGSEERGEKFVDDDITDGALTGGTIGGIGGLILGAGALAIPGVGPIIAAGPIAAALGGAVAGGVTGALIDWGIPAEVSEKYEREVAKGGILAIVQTGSQKVSQAAQIFRQSGARDVESHHLPKHQQELKRR